MDSNGNVLGSYGFDAFGTRASTDNSSDPYSGFGAQWGYYRDAETGLSLLGHRYYDPAQGRFLTRDPIGYRGGLNLYSYVGSNPHRFADPLGHQGYGHDPESRLRQELNGNGSPDEEFDPMINQGYDPDPILPDTSDCPQEEAERQPVSTIRIPYPIVNDPRTGRPIPLPDHNGPIDGLLPPWTNQDRYNYIKAWYDNGYPDPEYEWSKYEIHHILPRKFGGGNDFENLVPLLHEQHVPFTNWWGELQRAYV